MIVFVVYYRPVFSESLLGFGVSAGEFRDTPFVSAFALQSTSRNCSPAHDFGAMKAYLPEAFLSGGTLFQTPEFTMLILSMMMMIIVIIIPVSSRALFTSCRHAPCHRSTLFPSYELSSEPILTSEVLLPVIVVLPSLSMDFRLNPFLPVRFFRSASAPLSPSDSKATTISVRDVVRGDTRERRGWKVVPSVPARSPFETTETSS